MALAVAPHAERAAFLQRAQRLGRTFDRPGTWELFRFINPRYSAAADIVSGEGAWYAAGRWNPPDGTFLLSYTATDPETALAETLAHPYYYALPMGTALPRVLVSLRLQDFDHYAPAAWLIKHPEFLEDDTPEMADALGRFEELFSALNRLL